MQLDKQGDVLSSMPAFGVALGPQIEREATIHDLY
jgi:hypothetical protein